ncbi:putative reverse transcriptase domain-containing protein [Tanacetum coccineum]
MIERYTCGFPERIKGNITSSKPATLHDAINMAREQLSKQFRNANLLWLSGEKGHLKNKCPKAGNQHNEGARARAYVVVENPQQNPNESQERFLLYCTLRFYEVELADGKVSEEEHEVYLKMILDLLKKEKFKVESVKNWKTPESSTEIRSFSGLAGYYQRFIENSSKIAKPLTLLTQNNKTYVWGDEQDEVFRILKEKLCNAPVLALPDGPDDFVVYCDASK